MAAYGCGVTAVHAVGAGAQRLHARQQKQRTHSSTASRRLSWLLLALLLLLAGIPWSRPLLPSF